MINKKYLFIKNNGFTLIELLIVIALISLLASVVLSNMMGPRQDAKDMKALALMNSFSKAAYKCILKNKWIHDPPGVYNNNPQYVCGNDILDSGIAPSVTDLAKLGWVYPTYVSPSPGPSVGWWSDSSGFTSYFIAIKSSDNLKTIACGYNLSAAVTYNSQTFDFRNKMACEIRGY